MSIIKNLKKFNITLRISMLLLCFAFTGCASVKFLDKDGKNTGFAYHPAKPYLLIQTEKSAATAKIISIPDVSKECFVKKTGFLGSADLNLTVTDSMLTTIGAKTDSKIPETINALAALTNAGAAVAKPQAATLAEPPVSPPEVQLYEIIPAEDGKGIDFKKVFPR